ncbi:lytic murein transglycosylase [Yinghuangia sp. ASG 101]|uniref:lytic transglycosylase domain-containing protein n=1 Tax=Yinghuangia sp. ASG 101 TaxID=2896848 RepID=UPI001E62EBC4|nr:lytic murein transglycosylase [Yinghuangia sp. ASG 101]UGQ10115.1 lytic murein transglycosylase [Yinghuangia sp. ASG 101]
MGEAERGPGPRDPDGPEPSGNTGDAEAPPHGDAGTAAPEGAPRGGPEDRAEAGRGGGTAGGSPEADDSEAVDGKADQPADRAAKPGAGTAPEGTDPADEPDEPDEPDEIDAWITSLGAQPPEFARKELAAGDDASADGTAASRRRRLINPWIAAAAVAALLLVATTVVRNPFTMVTAERVNVSDVPKMSDPEPDLDNGPVDGGVPANLELPPEIPAAVPVTDAPPPDPSASAPAPSASIAFPPPGTPATVVTGSNGIPQIVLTAYQMAASTTAVADPACRLPWQLLAGIGRVESGHANSGQVDIAGTALTPILGPRLDGSNNTMAIRDTDGGALDYDREFDRAVGPMQFIPSSWRAYALDGNRDRKADPQNVFDAALTAARYLCAGDRDLSTPAGLERAIYSYNQSAAYVSSVKAWMAYYQTGVRPIVTSLPPVAAPPPAPAPPPPATTPVVPPPPATTQPPPSSPEPSPTTSPPPTTPGGKPTTSSPPTSASASPTTARPTGESSPAG